MNEAMDVINAFPTPLKVAWVVWLAWGVGQYFWFRHERSGASAASVAKPAVARAVARKPVAVVKAAAAVVETPVLGRLITPQHVAADPKHEPTVPPPAPEPPVFDVPVFDPSTAVIETFSGAPDESALDKFVAEFERHDAHPRRRPTLPVESRSFGVEAPHIP